MSDFLFSNGRSSCERVYGPRVALVDPVTEMTVGDVSQLELQSYITESGNVTQNGDYYFGGLFKLLGIGDDSYDQIPALTFRGGAQTKRARVGILSDEPFHGGSQVSDEYDDDFSIDFLSPDPCLGGPQTIVDASIARHEITYLQSVIQEIFDGRNDLSEIDTTFLLSTESGMPQTLRSLFVNKPGHGGGVSSLRHIFSGDKSGGRHVAAFEPGLSERVSSLWKPFPAVVSPDGRVKMNFVVDEVTGAKQLVPHETSMYPAGMDSMSVLMAITDAWQHRFDRSEYLTERNEIKKANVYEVPVAVGHEIGELTIRLITDLSTKEDKIRTAFPIIK